MEGIISEEEDEVIDEDVELDNETVSYESDTQEFVIKFKAYFAQSNAEIIILSPNEFKEVGLPSFEVMLDLMNPTERRGSVTRRIARVKIGDSVNYYLIKGVRDLEKGENEVKIGNALRSLKALTCVGAVFGFRAASNEVQNLMLYYVVVPWIIGAIPLNSFIRNKKPVEYNLSTHLCLQLIYPVLKDLVVLWNEARFSHMDCKLDQLLFVPVTDTSYQIILIDFGLSSIDVIIEGERIKVEACSISQTQVWLEDFSNFLNNCVQQFIACDCPNRDKELIKIWNSKRSQIPKFKLTPTKFIEWMELETKKS